MSPASLLDDLARRDDRSYASDYASLDGVLTLAPAASVEQVATLLQARVGHLAAIVRMGCVVGGELTAVEVAETIAPVVEDVEMLANALRIRARRAA